MVGHGGSSAGSYLADPTSPIPSHCASIVATSTVRVNSVLWFCFHQYSYYGNYSNWYTQASFCSDNSTNTMTFLPASFGSVLLLTLKVLVATIDAQWEGMGM